MKKKTLSKKEIRELNDKIVKYNYSYDKKDFVEYIDDGKHKAIKKDNEVEFFYLQDELIPSLKLILKGIGMKKVAVDMGAVKFVVNGADIMRPGVVEIDDDITLNEVITIVDVDNKKPLALGRAMYDSNGIKEKKEGKVVKNLHFIGDEIWDL